MRSATLLLPAAPIMGAAPAPAVSVRQQLARTQAAYAAAKARCWELRDSYFGPDRRQLRAEAKEHRRQARAAFAAAAEAFHASPQGRQLQRLRQSR